MKQTRSSGSSLKTFNLIKKEAARINGTQDENANKPIIILLAACVEGPNIKRIAKLTGYTRSEIAWRAANLRRSGVWKSGKIYADYWEKGGLGSYNLLLDANVAEGLMEKVPG